MSQSIPNSFIIDYQADVHEAFQKRGAILGGTVRKKDNIVGKQTTFQVAGKGMATSKARNGTITPMNQSHTAVPCVFEDFYAGDWVDKLDEAKTNIDERMVIANGGAWALGRKQDDQIINNGLALTTETPVVWVYTSSGAVLASVLETLAAINTNDVPNDGQRYAVVTPNAWAAMETIEQFGNANYVGPNGLPFTEGAPVSMFKRWENVMWTVHTGLTGMGTASATGFVYHKTAIGYGSGAFAGNVATNGAVAADITWHGDRAAHFVNHMMSGGACLIDGTGVIPMTLDDTAAIPST